MQIIAFEFLRLEWFCLCINRFTRPSVYLDTSSHNPHLVVNYRVTTNSIHLSQSAARLCLMLSLFSMLAISASAVLPLAFLWQEPAFYSKLDKLETFFLEATFEIMINQTPMLLKINCTSFSCNLTPYYDFLKYTYNNGTCVVADLYGSDYICQKVFWNIRQYAFFTMNLSLWRNVTCFPSIMRCELIKKSQMGY